MATSARLEQINPSMIAIAIVLTALALFAVTVGSIVGLTDRQNEKLVEYELRTVLQGNGDLLKSASSREFSQKISLADNDFFLRIKNTAKFTVFEVGSFVLESSGQCVVDHYFEFDLYFCRPKPIPWDFLKIVIVLFSIIIAIAFVVLRKLNLGLVLSFRRLFHVAEIPHPSQMGFSDAWKIATEMAERFHAFQKQAIEFERSKAVSSMAKQVAHDIRSPLSALNMVTHGLSEVSEERRLLIKNAVQRINDIANDLLKKSKSTQREQHEKTQANLDQDIGGVSEAVSVVSPQSHIAVLLPSVIDSIVSEKRMQARDKIDIGIEADLKDSFGAFVNASATELSRIVSNLVNNSVEALHNDTGEVTVAVRAYKDQVLLSVSDNGKGIPSDILAKLGKQELSYGKDHSETSGSGIGVYHAKKSVQAWGGSLQIQSRENVGTTVEIKLPRAENPSWFASVIKIQGGCKVISVDDDFSVHQIWKGRLESLKASSVGVTLQSFSSVSEFMKLKLDDSMVFLIDYEFLNHRENGLDLIKDRDIAARSVLVTSRHEEAHIRESCERLGIRILPKQLAGFVPIQIVQVDSRQTT